MLRPTPFVWFVWRRPHQAPYFLFFFAFSFFKPGRNQKMMANSK
jgi:hypothetical protein